MNRRTVRVYDVNHWRKLLIAHLTKGMSKTDDAYKMIVKGVECLDNHGLQKMCAKSGLILPRGECSFKWPLEVRFIFEMRQFGMDLYAVLELLQEEFPELSLPEIRRRTEPFRMLAQKWYTMGDNVVHGVIQGWVAAAVNKN
jgi:hypothetical protein